MSKKTKYYVVWAGHNPGVYDDWRDAQEQIHGFPGARYKAYTTPQAAAEAVRRGYDNDDGKVVGRLVAGLRQHRVVTDCNWRDIPDIDQTAWAVDASCMGNPGIMEYQGVDLATGKVIFRVGPFEEGTNNIGEFLAIVHALALMHRQGVSHTIYSDSKIAQGWVARGVVRTKVARTPRNERLFQLIERAIIWLHTNTFRTRIVKWDTRHWGEIPADFGRK